MENSQIRSRKSVLFLTAYDSIGCMEMNRKKQSILPQKPPEFTEELLRLAPPETSSADHFEAILNYLDAKQDAWTLEQDRRLMKSEKRILWCSYLRGLLRIFGGVTKRKHFSWCPFEEWMGNEFMAIYNLPHGEHRH